MADQRGYPTRRTLSRRAMLRTAVAAGGGAAALALAACGRGERERASSGTTPAAAPATAEIDPTKGKPGGKLVFQAYGDYGGLVLVKSRNAGIHQAGSFTHSGLYQMRNGRPGVDLSDMSSELDVAAAFPEQPDELTYIVKLKEGIRFQNGRPLTAEDVKYSYERYAFAADSAYKADFPWLDKVEAPDATTVVFKTVVPFADTLGALTARTEGHILAKEHEEGPDAANRLMGSGPFIFVERLAPVLMRFRRNPDYFAKPWPYFDEVEVLGTSDTAKKVADFSARQVHVTYWFDEERRDEVKRNRPDALLFANIYPGWGVVMRTDQPPFNDKRVRQALSMAMNRKQIIDGIYKGEGEDDQVFSWTIKTWGFRKPKDLGPAAKYWEYNPAEAKKLLAAAGITQPIETVMHHWDATVVGPGMVDLATLIQSQWRSAGIANCKDDTQTFAQFASTVAIGNFEGLNVGPGGGGVLSQAPGNVMRNTFWSPPEGVKTPTVNNGHVNNPRLSQLVDKQRSQLDLEERKKTFREIEELMAEEQYRLALNTFSNNFFADPSLRNIQIPITHVNGSVHYVKYWWFEK